MEGGGGGGARRGSEATGIEEGQRSGQEVSGLMPESTKSRGAGDNTAAGTGTCTHCFASHPQSGGGCAWNRTRMTLICQHAFSPPCGLWTKRYQMCVYTMN